MKKSEAEKRIKDQIHRWKPDWRSEVGNLHFSEYWEWLKENDWECTQFRSTMGAYADAEMWFDHETGQAGWN